MINTTLRAITAGLATLSGACPTPEPTTQPKPPCTGYTVILDDFEQYPDCDVIPPQVMVIRMEDPGPIQELTCLNHGGIPMIDQKAGTAYCLDIDY